MINLTPNVATKHWSAAYVGLPWTREFDCWGLVQLTQRNHFGREVPELAGDLRDLARRSGWEKVTGSAHEGDVIFMHGEDGPHIGVAIDATRILHSLGWMEDDGPHGSVRIDRLDQLGRLGFGRMECWRFKE